MWWDANLTTGMAYDVFESWMTSLNVYFKNQRRKVLSIMDNFATHVGRGESFGFSTLKLSDITISIRPSNVTSVVQPLDQGKLLHSEFNVRRRF